MRENFPENSVRGCEDSPAAEIGGIGVIASILGDEAGCGADGRSNAHADGDDGAKASCGDGHDAGAELFGHWVISCFSISPPGHSGAHKQLCRSRAKLHLWQKYAIFRKNRNEHRMNVSQA